MLHTTLTLNIDYDKAGIEHTGEPVTLKTYIHDHHDAIKGNSTRPLILICPGGGYDHLAIREGEPIALKMNSLGYNACILSYSLTPNHYPYQLIEAAAAIRAIKEHSNEWHVDPEKICICGFSAGGHVAGSLGTMWKDEVITKVLGGSSEDYKPAAMLLSYPVITAGEFAHRGSFNMLINNNPELYDTVSLEKRVNQDTVPAFIWHTYEDNAVPVENSLLMTMALRKYNIPCEFHMYRKGCHGLALATEETNILTGGCIQLECSNWPDMFAAWFKGLFL